MIALRAGARHCGGRYLLPVSCAGRAVGIQRSNQRAGVPAAGFVAAGIYYSLTSHPKPGAFERIIQALIFTAVIQAVRAALPDSTPSAEVDIGADAPWDPVWPVAIAIVLALVVVVVVNHDILHRLLRRLGVTRETSYASQWYSSFDRNRGLPVVLHLVGKRRLYGWAEEWPSHPGEGHFRVVHGEWLDSEPEVSEGEQGMPQTERSDQSGGGETVVVGTLIPFAEVEMVEFVGNQDDRDLRRSPWFKRLRRPRLGL